MSKRTHTNRYGATIETVPLHLATSPHYRSLIAQMEDRRRFAFNPLAPPASVRRMDRRIEVRPSVVHGKATFHGLKFSVPERVALCAKRKIRKEVLFAFKHGGKGGAKKRQPRRNFWSQIGC